MFLQNYQYLETPLGRESNYYRIKGALMCIQFVTLWSPRRNQDSVQ
jgi:hypothetical protein